MPSSATIRLNVFDGRRKTLDASLKLLITLRDGTQKQLKRDYYGGRPLTSHYSLVVTITSHAKAEHF